MIHPVYYIFIIPTNIFFVLPTIFYTIDRTLDIISSQPRRCDIIGITNFFGIIGIKVGIKTITNIFFLTIEI